MPRRQALASASWRISTKRGMIRLGKSLPLLKGLHGELVRARDERDRWRREAREVEDRLRSERKRRIAAERRLTDELSRPSFTASYYRTKRVRAEMRHGSSHLDPIWRFNDKLEGRRLAERVGVPVAGLIGTYPDLASLDLRSAIPIVVKPTGGSTSRGVYPLAPSTTTSSYSIFHGRDVSHRDIQRELSELLRRRLIAPPFLVEELVAPRGGLEVPDDWKLYVIGGRVELVLQKRNNSSSRVKDASLKWYDRGGTDLGRVADGRHDADLPSTASLPKMVEHAEAIAQAIGTTFVRVDLLDGLHHPTFGEITPEPGGLQLLREDVDVALGEAMDRAEATRLAALELGL